MLKRPLLFALVLSQGLTAWATGACERAEAQQLEIRGLGRATVGSFQADTARGRLELSGGVCLGGEGGWQLETPELTVTMQDDTPQIRAESVTLSIGGWQLEAELLLSRGERFSLNRLSFRGFGTTGEASSAAFDLETADLALREVTAQSTRFRITGDTARLSGTQLRFFGATATTCVCDGALYLVRTPEASYDLASDEVLIEDGILQLGGLELPLGERLDLSPEALADLSFPVTIEFVPDDAEEGIDGTGLGILAPSLPLAENLRLELGLTGLDSSYPFRGVAVLHYDDGRTRFDLGLGKRGPQADARLDEPLTPWLDAYFEVNNRDWQAADFLHEGRLGLVAQEVHRPWRRAQLRTSAELFAAASAQTLEGTQVMGARLGLKGGLELTYRPTPWRFQVGLMPQLNAYPAGTVGGATAEDDSYEGLQYGLRLGPSVRYQRGPVRIETSFERQWTNSASPFGESLDRLLPESRLHADLSLSGALTPSWSASLTTRMAYSFLPSEDLAPSASGFETLRPGVTLTYQRGDFLLETGVQAALAPLMTEQDDEARLETSLRVGSSAFQVGLRGDFILPDGRLDVFETSAEFPLRVSKTLVLQPFIAVDWLPLSSSGEPPRFSGYGLGLSWESCCGTLKASLRQRENRFVTTFAIEL